MNKFSCSFGTTLSDKIPKTSNPLLENEFSVNPQNLCFKFEAINMSQIGRVFGNFKTSKGSGPDGIANYFLKMGLPVIAESLCDIFDLSIATGVFPPDSWKIARGAPFLKVVNQMIVLITDRSQCCHFCPGLLVWDEHTKFMRAKVSRAIGFLKYAKKILPQETLSQM